jgi:hypothetical protein
MQALLLNKILFSYAVAGIFECFNAMMGFENIATE